MSRSMVRIAGARRAALTATMVLALLATIPTAAQVRAWQKVERTPALAGLPAKAAAVSNEQGYVLQVQMADPSRLLAIFRLPPGLSSLDSDGCPTFKVDDLTPDPLHIPAGRCHSDGAEATLEVARIVEGKLESEIMLQLLNGEALAVIHRIQGAGYRTARFSLKGSKSALLAALPQGTAIAAD